VSGATLEILMVCPATGLLGNMILACAMAAELTVSIMTVLQFDRKVTL
jgi:hypothetical protein